MGGERRVGPWQTIPPFCPDGGVVARHFAHTFSLDNRHDVLHRTQTHRLLLATFATGAFSIDFLRQESEKTGIPWFKYNPR